MSTKILFLYDNLVNEPEATLVGSSESEGFPVENLQHPFRTRLWTTTSDDGSVVIDLGSSKAVTCVALTGYNWTDAPNDLDLEFNTEDSWGAPPATEALTWAANPTANGNRACIIKTFDSKSYRFIRLNVVNGNPAANAWSLGRIFLGTHFEPNVNWLISPFGFRMVDPSIGSRSIGGQQHFDVFSQYREVTLGFRAESLAQFEEYQKLFTTVGIHKNIFMALDYDNEPNEMTLYGTISSILSSSIDGPTHRPLGFTFKEAV